MGVKFLAMLWVVCGVSDSVDEGAGSRVVMSNGHCRIRCSCCCWR